MYHYAHNTYLLTQLCLMVKCIRRILLSHKTFPWPSPGLEKKTYFMILFYILEGQNDSIFLCMIFLSFNNSLMILRCLYYFPIKSIFSHINKFEKLVHLLVSFFVDIFFYPLTIVRTNKYLICFLFFRRFIKICIRYF